MKRHFMLVFAGLAVLLGNAAPSPAALLNGGFEAPVLAPNTFQTILPGGEPVGFAWKVASGDVDLGYTPINPFIQFPAYEGFQALDLNGNVAGAIYQDFATVAGLVYQVQFAYADNPTEGGISSAAVNVTDVSSSNSLLSTSVSHSTSTNGPPAFADWQISTSTFTAQGALTRLAFTSTSVSTGSSGGILLDAVGVTVVPEPATFALAICGLIAMATCGWRRRKR